MQQTILGVMRPQPSIRVSRFGTSTFWLITLLFTNLFMAVFVVSSLAKALGDGYRADPFAAFTDIFPGQQPDIRFLEADGFSCWLESQPSPADISYRCYLDLQTGAFSRISLTLWDETVRRLDFTVRANALAVGDLIELWGSSEIHMNGNLVLVNWSDYHIIASGSSPNGRFSYFQNLTVISFAMGT